MPRGSSSSKVVELDPEIDRTYRRRLRSLKSVATIESAEKQFVGEKEQVDLPEFVGDDELKVEEVVEEDIMADQRRTMAEYTRPNLTGASSCIVQPAIEANNFDVKASTMNMIYNQCQFDGLPDEDPNAHIEMFLDICNTVKQNGVSDEALRLRIFPFTLRGKAR